MSETTWVCPRSEKIIKHIEDCMKCKACNVEALPFILKKKVTLYIPDSYGILATLEGYLKKMPSWLLVDYEIEL